MTDGASLPDGGYVLRDYVQAYVYSASGALRTTVDLPEQPQGESLAVVRGGRDVLVGSEGVHSAVYRVALPPVSSPSPTPAVRGAADPTATTSAAETAAQRHIRVLTRVVIAGGAMLLAVLVMAALARRRSSARP